MVTALIIIVLGITFFLNKAKYSSFLELVPKEEISKIDRTVIEKYLDNTDTDISITDKQLIDKILYDFSQMK
ncbi:hypothetical protein [Neobacillus rhizosphaerae]|uniref:hypothetical protein n=1 Tax=Neobacillus rhizosphaerae TaxID=2880965 RepID=UPI00200F4903|nr:hypothetical protein [Neobacillus rhizosphaerae]